MDISEFDEHKAGKLLELASLTYNQLRTWENRAGVTASERVTSKEWHKFSKEEVMAMVVCAAVRKPFSLPLERMHDLHRWLMGKKHGSNRQAVVEFGKTHLKYMESDEYIRAIIDLPGEQLKEALKDRGKADVIEGYLMAKIQAEINSPIRGAFNLAMMGFPVYLLKTDSIQLLTEFQLMEDLIMLSPVSTTIVIHPLHTIFNKMLGKSNRRVGGKVKSTPSFSDHWWKLHEGIKVSENEREVIRRIREREYQCVTAHVRGNKIIRVDTDDVLSSTERAAIEGKILAIIGRKGYQTVTLIEQDGKVVSFSRKTHILLE